MSGALVNNESITAEELAAIHDFLLENKPADLEHVEEECPICQKAEINHQGGGFMQTYTDEEVQALLQKITELESEVAEFRLAADRDQFEIEIQKVKQEAEEELASVKVQLDNLVLENANLKQEKADILIWLEAEVEAKAQEALLRERKEARLAVIEEVASFPEEYVQQNLERWVALDEGDFEALVADWKAIGNKSVDDELPSVTAMTATSSSGSSRSAVKEVLRFRYEGVDPRSL